MGVTVNPISGGGGGASAWGDITGTLSNQTDLDTVLDAKAPIASPTFTGTVSGVTKTHVGLGNVVNVDTTNASNINSGTLSATRLPTAIDATKIANGTISNTEFQHLNGVTSNIQTQINGIAGGFWNYTATRTSDSSVTSSTTYTNPFSVSMTPSGAASFYVRAVIYLDNNGQASVGYKFKLSDWLGIMNDYSWNIEVVDTAYSKKVVSTGTATDMIEVTDATQTLSKGAKIVIDGYMKATSGGMYQLEFNFAQGTSSANAVYLRAGSYVMIKQV